MSSRRTYEITEEQYVEAIFHLENGGTKKRACEILGVSNNKTMERLIAEHVERKEVDKRLRAKRRREPITKQEVVNWITGYLQGESFAELSDSYYRSANVIRSRIESAGALLRVTEKINPLSPPLLPEQCISETFDIGQIVWSAKYGCAVEVVGVYKNAYRIKVANTSVQESAYQAAYELGSLKHLEDLGVDISILVKHYTKDCMAAVNRTIHEMNKAEKKR